MKILYILYLDNQIHFAKKEILILNCIKTHERIQENISNAKKILSLNFNFIF
jgi:hypothetical protein